MAETINKAALLKQGMERLLKSQYGDNIAPPSYITSTGVKTLDALLGGGLSSSLPCMISSTPETGKSTFCFTFAKSFLDNHTNSVVVYLDIEGASECKDSAYGARSDTFGLDPERFLYMPAVLNVKQVFDTIEQFSQAKKQFEEKSGERFHVLIIWDSLAATSSSKDASTEDHNSVIGFKAREISHMLSHHKSTIIMSSLTILVVDQVRADIQIQGPFAPKVDKTVGMFQGFKSATNVNALQHNIKQWLYLSKGTILNPNDGFGVDGWELEITTVKNKLAASSVSVTCVFDKKYGVIPLLSEYLFMRDMTATEKKRTKKDPKKLPYPLSVSVDGRSKVINIYDDQNKVIVKSEKFTERNLIEKYYNEPEFKKIFDKALELSIEGRIIKGLFRETIPEKSKDVQPSTAVDTETGIEYNPETGEIIE